MPNGWYSPLILAWTGAMPTPGQRIPTRQKWAGGDTPQMLYIVREATLEEWEISQAERGYSNSPRSGARYFEVHTD